MKRIVAIIGVVVFMLAGCSEKIEKTDEEDVDNETKPKQEEVKKEIQQLIIDESIFHFIVDWLSDDEVLFVEKEAKEYRLKAFNIYTKAMKTIYADENMIADVLVHPSKDYFLIQTSTSASSATVKMISLDGVVQNEVTIESTELAIEWNDLDPALLLLTAFYEDWSYDAFYFNGSTNDLTVLSIENPFPKWLGVNHFVHSGSLEGEQIAIYDVQTGEKEWLNERSIAYFDTFEDTLLVVQMTKDEKAAYTIVNKAQDVLMSWMMPFSEGDAGQEIPHFEWIDETSVLSLRPMEGERFVNVLYELVKFEGEEETALMSNLENARLVCSPNKKKCLTGDGLEQLLDLEKMTKTSWLQ